MADQASDPQDPLIRVILTSAAVAVAGGILTAAFVVVTMISLNFNFLNWME
ncbi:MAG: hypothetical protein WCG66_05480 [bacterium]